MSRVIKFRAWDDVEKKMIDFPLNQLINGCSSGASVYFHGLRSFRNNIMEYIGLKDKNGIEIYDGDLIRGSGKPLKVIFQDGAFIGKHESHKLNSWTDLRIWNDTKHQKKRITIWEIVGNIYENPELLKEPT